RSSTQKATWVSEGMDSATLRAPADAESSNDAAARTAIRDFFPTRIITFPRSRLPSLRAMVAETLRPTRFIDGERAGIGKEMMHVVDRQRKGDAFLKGSLQSNQSHDFSALIDEGS